MKIGKMVESVEFDAYGEVIEFKKDSTVEILRTFVDSECSTGIGYVVFDGAEAITVVSDLVYDIEDIM